MPAALPRRNNEAELKAFEATCLRLNGFDDAIAFEWVDGYLAGLAATARLPEADEWLQAMFEDTFDRAFADPEDRAQALHSLQVRLKVLCDQLDPSALFEDPGYLRLEPLFEEWTDEDRQRAIDEDGLSVEDAALLQTGSLWAEGFIDAFTAFESVWPPAPDEDTAAAFGQCLDHVAALMLPPGTDEWNTHVAEYYPKGPPTRDELLAEACWSAQDLRMYGVDFAPKPAQRRVEAAPGRNDPCPCGSGKKFKKCHGA
jgi:uncharacterized protein